MTDRVEWSEGLVAFSADVYADAIRTQLMYRDGVLFRVMFGDPWERFGRVLPEFVLFPRWDRVEGRVRARWGRVRVWLRGWVPVRFVDDRDCGTCDDW